MVAVVRKKLKGNWLPQNAIKVGNLTIKSLCAVGGTTTLIIRNKNVAIFVPSIKDIPSKIKDIIDRFGAVKMSEGLYVYTFTDENGRVVTKYFITTHDENGQSIDKAVIRDNIRMAKAMGIKYTAMTTYDSCIKVLLYADASNTEVFMDEIHLMAKSYRRAAWSAAIKETTSRGFEFGAFSATVQIEYLPKEIQALNVVILEFEDYEAAPTPDVLIIRTDNVSDVLRTMFCNHIQAKAIGGSSTVYGVENVDTLFAAVNSTTLQANIFGASNGVMNKTNTMSVFSTKDNDNERKLRSYVDGSGDIADALKYDVVMATASSYQCADIKGDKRLLSVFAYDPAFQYTMGNIFTDWVQFYGRKRGEKLSFLAVLPNPTTKVLSRYTNKWVTLEEFFRQSKRHFEKVLNETIRNIEKCNQNDESDRNDVLFDSLTVDGHMLAIEEDGIVKLDEYVINDIRCVLDVFEAYLSDETLVAAVNSTYTFERSRVKFLEPDTFDISDFKTDNSRNPLCEAICKQKKGDEYDVQAYADALKLRETRFISEVLTVDEIESCEYDYVACYRLAKKLYKGFAMYVLGLLKDKGVTVYKKKEVKKLMEAAALSYYKEKIVFFSEDLFLYVKGGERSVRTEKGSMKMLAIDEFTNDIVEPSESLSGALKQAEQANDINSHKKNNTEPKNEPKQAPKHIQASIKFGVSDEFFSQCVTS
jgi:hypothetical protein